MTSPRATVAICTRNRARTLPVCLTSVLAQDYPKQSYEVILVDDESTDTTQRIAQQFIRNSSPQLRYIRQPYGGLSVARNRAISEARSDLVCFLDDDAEASPGWVGALIQAAAEHSDVECFAGRLLLRLEGKAPRTCGAESLGAELDEGDEERELDGLVTRARGSNLAIRRAAFERIGLFNPALVWRGDEDNWQKRLVEQGGRVLYVPRALVWHRRLKSDLRRRTLLKTRFGWGVGQVQYKRESGVPWTFRKELKVLRKDLRHAYEERCFGGILEAAIRVGALWGAITGELRKPRSGVPRLTRPRID